MVFKLNFHSNLLLYAVNRTKLDSPLFIIRAGKIRFHHFFLLLWGDNYEYLSQVVVQSHGFILVLKLVELLKL
jgi:hypothetical protein